MQYVTYTTLSTKFVLCGTSRAHALGMRVHIVRRCIHLCVYLCVRICTPMRAHLHVRPHEPGVHLCARVRAPVCSTVCERT